MKEITVKNIPEKMYKKLETKAIMNNHSIDEEVLIHLINLTGDNSDNKTTSKDWQKISKINRDIMKFVANDKEISEFKNIVRP